jgi:glycerate kinase
MDGGLGFLCACGLVVEDAHGRVVDVEQVGAAHALGEVSRVAFEPNGWMRDAFERGVRFVAACDVVNPLCGGTGAAMTFGIQKGATDEQTRELDAGMARLAKAMEHAGIAEGGSRDEPGAGAAGGLGFAMRAVLGAELARGFEVVREATGLDGLIDGATLVITGEGRLDGQSSMGKVAMGVAGVAASKGARCIAVVGRCGEGWERTLKTNGCPRGFDAVLEASAGVGDVEAMSDAARLLKEASRQAWVRIARER